MKKDRSSLTGRNTLEVVEQAFILLRSTPPRVWVLYFLGSVPFLFVILYFWTDMSYSAFATRRVAPFALVLALAYVSMKSFHAFFSRALLASLSMEDPGKISFFSFLREFRTQCLAQTAFLVLVPASIAAMVPFPWVVAFFEHSVLVNGEKMGAMDKLSRSWALAREEPRENHLLLWLTSPLLFVLGVALMLLMFHLMVRVSPGMQADMDLSFHVLSGMLVFFSLILSPACTVGACNIGLLIFMLPGILRTFFGVETTFSLSGSHLFNTTFILSVTVLAYLACKPLNLAVYVLRHFLSSSVRSGADLKASTYRYFPAVMGLVFFSLFLLPSARAENAPAGSTQQQRIQELQAAIKKSASQPEYAWRLPKFQESTGKKGILEDFFNSVSDFLKSAGKSLKDFFKKAGEWFDAWMEKLRAKKQPDAKPSEFFKGLPSLDKITWILGGLTVLVLAFAFWLAYRYRIGRKKNTPVLVEAVPVATPDLSDESTTADLLESDEWMELAEKLMKEGQYRSALRAMYLGLLARLAKGGFFVIHPAKSNRDYRNEFRLHSRHDPSGTEEFNACVFLFEQCWYGTHPVDAEVIRQFQAHHEQLRKK